MLGVISLFNEPGKEKEKGEREMIEDTDNQFTSF
ncbi:hypothetical protein J3R74_002240 [Puniceicoccus vermicola]